MEERGLNVMTNVLSLLLFLTHIPVMRSYHALKSTLQQDGFQYKYTVNQYGSLVYSVVNPLPFD